MSGGYGEFRSYRAILDEKRKAIEKDLASAPPTVILSRPEGIYIFAKEIAKVHSTIVLAGAGQMFIPIADWFRGRINDLISGWGHNVPRADVEGNLLLPAAFHDNHEASGNVVLADIMIIELGNEPEKDYIARVDFLGRVQEFRQGTVVLNYNAKEDPAEEEEENGKKSDSDDDRVKEGMREDTRNELVKLKCVSLHALEHLDDDPASAKEFLDGLKTNYPGRKGFLRRDLLMNKSFPWIYEML